MNTFKLKLRTPEIILVESKLRVGRSSETISQMLKVPLQEVEDIQDKYWEEYVASL